MKAIAEIIDGKCLVRATSSENVREVARRMTERNVGAVAVLEGDNLVGMFTERDLMTRAVAKDLDLDTTGIGMVMTRELTTASPQESVAECLQKMHKLNCRHLPVVDQGTLVGMISLRDLLQVDNQEVHHKAQLLGELVTYSPDYES